MGVFVLHICIAMVQCEWSLHIWIFIHTELGSWGLLRTTHWAVPCFSSNAHATCKSHCLMCLAPHVLHPRPRNLITLCTGTRTYCAHTYAVHIFLRSALNSGLCSLVYVHQLCCPQSKSISMYLSIDFFHCSNVFTFQKKHHNEIFNKWETTVL